MRVDLNADLGESTERWANGDDRVLLEAVTSANVCTGSYAGNAELITETCHAAQLRGVTIGAQVGYPDRANFGRVFVDMSFTALLDEISEQILTLQRIASEVGARVQYVKPHGALYHAVTTNETQAFAVVDAIAKTGALPLIGPPGSMAMSIAKSFGVKVVVEGFADRGYQADGSLIPRGRPGDVLTDQLKIDQQVRQLASIGVKTICVHSDTPQAVRAAYVARRALETSGHQVASFV